MTKGEGKSRELRSSPRVSPKESPSQHRSIEQKETIGLPGRHLGLELDLSIADVVAQLGRESSGSNRRKHGSRRRVTGPDAVGSSGIRGCAGVGKVKRVSVVDLSIGEDVAGESWDDVKSVVFDEGVGVVVRRPVKLAVSSRKEGGSRRVRKDKKTSWRLQFNLERRETDPKPPMLTSRCHLVVSSVSKLSSMTKQSFPM